MKRIVLNAVEDLSSPLSDECVATVGVFDGMHQGHLKVLHLMQEAAAGLKVPRTVVTFSSHPDEILGKRPPEMIISMEHRLRLLERNGIDLAVVLPFSREIRSISAHRFLTDFLIGSLNARTIVLGHDSAFGKNREGNVDFLNKYIGSHGISVLAAKEVSVRGKVISSTRIRDAIRSGDLALAEEMLGREVSILGKVIHGDGRGRQIGFPTANVGVETEIIPPAGVYEVIILFWGIRKRAVLSIGTRPTFHGTTEAVPTVEVHIPGFSGNLYGKVVEVFIVRKIRDQKRFDSVEELLENIRRDIESLRLPAARDVPPDGKK